MEWREQTSVGCTDAFNEARRWMEEVTKKSFGSGSFRSALENGVLLLDLVNQLKPGVIRRVNRLSTPIAGLDNVNVFLKACGKLGLKEAQLFHPGDLQDLSSRATLRGEESNRRLKNVLITIYWLGRKAQVDPIYSGPQLNFKAFEGLLGLALSKALEDGSLSVRDSGYSESWYPEREELQHLRPAYSREDSADSVDSLESRTLHTCSEGWGSDAEADQGFRMEAVEAAPPLQQTRGYVPPPVLRRKGQKDNGSVFPSPLLSSSEGPAALPLSPTERAIDEELFLRALWGVQSDGGDEEDEDTEADPVLDDLYARKVLQSLHQTSTNHHTDRFLPRYWTPAEEARVRAIYLGSQTRPWYRKMMACRTCQIQITPGRPPPVNPDWTWSKSMGDVGCDGGAYAAGDADLAASGLDGDQMDGDRPRETEAKWHDDLSKWKLRRRSTTSDLLRKLQEREVTSQMGSKPRTSPRERGPQSGPQNRDHHASLPSPPSSPTSKQPCSGLPPHTRVLLARSPTRAYSPHNQNQTQGQNQAQNQPKGSFTDAMPASDPSILGERIHSPSLASDGAEVTTPTLNSPFSSQTPGVSQAANRTVFLTMSRLDPTGADLTNRTALATVLRNDNTTTPPLAKAATPDNTPNGLFSSGVTGGPTLWKSPITPTTAAAGQQASPTTVDALTDQSYVSQEEAQQRSGEQPAEQAKDLYRYSSRTGSWSGSASLPRGYRRSEGSARLSAVITAKPFGAKSRVSSLPRLCSRSVDDYNSPPDGDPSGSLRAAAPTLHSQAAPPQVRGQPQAATAQCAGNQDVKEDEGRRAEERSATPHATTFGRTKGPEQYPKTQPLPQPYPHRPAHPHPQRPSHPPPQRPTQPPPQRPVQPLPQPYPHHPAQPLPQPYPHHPAQPLSKPYPQQKVLYRSRLSLPYNQAISPPEDRHSDMRVSLSLKPSSRPDFGLQTHWDSTGARVQSIQLGSPAEQCQLCVGDEIIAVGGVKVSQMTYEQWKGTMTSALQTGNLTMDVRRYGNKDWGSADGHLNPPRPSRKTINLTADAPMLIGRTDHHADHHTDHNTVKSAHLNGRPLSGVSSEGVDGGLCDDNPTTTGSKGGSESAISDLQVPSLSSCSSSYSWDHEEERKRQERWQEEQERLLQEQYQRDQERLDAEWQRAQHEAMDERSRKPEQSTSEVANGVASPRDAPDHVNGGGSFQKTDAWQSRDGPGTTFNEAESKQQTTQSERQTAQSERQTAESQQQITESKQQTTESQQQTSESKQQTTESQQQTSESKRQTSDSERPTAERREKVVFAEGDWPGGACGFTPLSPADRAKSKSTPVLGNLHKQLTQVKKGTSPAEQERLLILEEMRKRTHLLNDNSWIRQRSTSMYKEPIYIGVPMRRYESLDNLHTSWHQSPAPAPSSTAPCYSRPQSAAAGYCGPSRSASPRYSTGGPAQRPGPWPPMHPPAPPGDETAGSMPGSLQGSSGTRTCGVCEHALNSEVAVANEAHGLYFHLSCFQCVDCGRHLGGTAPGGEVRFQNRKPYCEHCCVQLESPPGPSL